MADKNAGFEGPSLPTTNSQEPEKRCRGCPKAPLFLEVFATDPGSVPDFTAFCETTREPHGRQDEAEITGSSSARA